MLYGLAVLRMLVCLLVSLTKTEPSDEGQAPPYRQTWRSTMMSYIVRSETQNMAIRPKGAQTPDDQLQSDSDRLSLSESPYTRFAPKLDLTFVRGTWWHSWLRHCATSRKVAGSIPDGVTGIFH
jgi:hypothetical protein